jgi:hypothetical protein
MKVDGSIRRVDTLSDGQVERMFELMVNHYDNVHRDKFERDLKAKDGVLLITDRGNVVQGFSSYRLVETRCDEGRCRALFSGDTVVDQSHWGQRSLFRSFAKLISSFMKGDSDPLYWFLISKGIRTYLMLPLYFKEYYPRAGTETPERARVLIEHLSHELFGEFYLRDQGIIRVVPPADRLKAELAKIPEPKQSNPHVRFYLDTNPGYVDGDELPSIARIDWDNFTPATLRFMRET